MKKSNGSQNSIEGIKYASAIPGDETEIRVLLSSCQLPSDDITSHLADFVVAKLAGKLVGVLGLEVCGEFGLLRSLAVAPEFRRRGIARDLHTHILARARLHNLKGLYLLTLTAAGYAAQLGFFEIKRENVPKSVQAATSFHSLCPRSSTVMYCRLPDAVDFAFPRSADI